MKGFLRLLVSERLKLSKSFIWLLIPLSPIISLLIGLLVSVDHMAGSELKLQSYAVLSSAMSAFHAWLFLPMLAGIFSAFVCRYEHTGGGWKQLLSLPVSRTALFFSKFTIVAALLAITQLLFLCAVIAAGAYHGLNSDIPWGMLISGVGSGFLACLPLAALQMLISISWSSFAAPLAINAALTIPNMLVLNSEKFGPFYPWAQPMLAMLNYGDQAFGAFALPLQNLLITVLGSFVLFLTAGLIYFNRKEI